MFRWTAWLIAGLGLGLSIACVLALDHERACGDGFVDEAAGERCDPLAARSTWMCKEPETAACGADTCVCSHCGDREVEGDEQCDDGNLDNLDNCTEACRFAECGDGWVQPGEVCEALPSVAVNNECSGLPGPPYYATGQWQCTLACTIDDQDCSLCGNGMLDGPWMNVAGRIVPAEACDGDDGAEFDPEAYGRFCADACEVPANASDQLACDATCKDDCSGFSSLDDRPLEERGCCIPFGCVPGISDGEFPCCQPPIREG